MRAVSPERETEQPKSLHFSLSKARIYCISVQFSAMLFLGMFRSVESIVVFFEDSTSGTAVVIKKIQINIPSIFFFIFPFYLPLNVVNNNI